MVHPLLVANFSTIVGGGEIGLIDLCASLNDRQIDLTVAVPDKPPTDLLTDHPRRSLIPWDIWPQSRAIKQLVQENNIDVIHTTGARGLTSAFLARTGKPIIWHVRVADNDKFDFILESLAHLIIANSNATAERFSTSAPVSVIYNGVMPFESSDTRLLPDTQNKKIGIIGRMTPEKGHLDLIPAILQIQKLHDNIEFIFIGNDTGAIGDQIKQLANRPDSRIRNLGVVPSASRHLHEFDLVIVPSRIEGFGRVAAECLVAGVPVIATAVGGLKEVLANLENIFLPDDTKDWRDFILESLTNYPHTTEDLTAAGKAFTMDQHTDAIIEVYKRLASEE